MRCFDWKGYEKQKETDRIDGIDLAGEKQKEKERGGKRRKEEGGTVGEVQKRGPCSTTSTLHCK